MIFVYVEMILPVQVSASFLDSHFETLGVNVGGAKLNRTTSGPLNM